MTWFYATILAREGGNQKLFVIKQGMNDARVANHRETDEPIKGILLGGYGVRTPGASSKPSGEAFQALYLAGSVAVVLTGRPEFSPAL